MENRTLSSSSLDINFAAQDMLQSGNRN